MIIISPEPIEELSVRAQVDDPRSGAVVTFSGVVRELSLGKKVQKLFYEAHETMAESKLKSIVDTAMQKWQLNKIAVQHRTGLLEVGDVAVVIAVAAPHRKEAFQACQYIIDKIKEDVPIWKKEFYDEGGRWISTPEENNE
ncbi:MAG: hypothetical protein A2161_03325 [Candidatus Schekmanbacteria bacterium RBG_13_48_7]|uniref:Molybdenum cofactor biosynthesis protein MoaE n=1 Tax=Candidatus Schekmanbacteria bacterium RBG_13_48_7 TaxID=1817878 RepID=A0A1F7RV73_9BACT|nr:MAG: hypothetical protein A2161_03325 [Candidatus Schekmanbacteria bacterium RBG_13_48_7]